MTKEREPKIIKLSKVSTKINSKKMLITHYSFFSGLTQKKLHGVSRTYDNIAFPSPNSKYFENYKSFFTFIYPLRNIINK